MKAGLALCPLGSHNQEPGCEEEGRTGHPQAKLCSEAGGGGRRRMRRARTLGFPLGSWEAPHSWGEL